MTFTLLFILLALFTFSLDKGKTIGEVESVSLLGAFFGVSSIVFILYNIFFLLAPYLVSFNISYPAESYTPLIGQWINEHDGMESFALYVFCFLSIGMSYFLLLGMNRIKSFRVYVPIVGLFSIITFFYFSQIGWYPPMESASVGISALYLVEVILILTFVFLTINKYSFSLFFFIAALILIPICFIAVQSLEVFDYSFVWSPAYRLLHGYHPDEIYFQYDLFLSILAAAWMKLKIDLGYFQIIGQASFYLFFLFNLLFAKQFFKTKDLVVPFFICILLVRYFAIMHEPTLVFQVTPLRLDLWIILAFFVFHKGINHWLVALAVGVLVIIHKNFGLLYLAAYSELIFVFFIVEFIDKEKKTWRSLFLFLKKQFKLQAINLLILIVSLVVTIWLFGAISPTSARLYQQIGIGMLPISATSFYWYLLLLLSITFFMILNLRKKLSDNYTSTAVFIVFLTIANSMYFFGRSHEHNIINISACFVWLLFLFIDLILSDKKRMKLYLDRVNLNVGQSLFNRFVFHLTVIPLIAIIVFSYSERIIDRVGTQYSQLKNFNLGYKVIEPPFKSRISLVRTMTNGSDKVYFVDFYNDFMYTYTGHYKPAAYFFPIAASIFNKEMFESIQSLLDRDYYIVIEQSTMNHYQQLPLEYTTMTHSENFYILKK
jgi:hypothetical protein